MTSSAAVDGRVVIAVEKLLNAGVIIYSEKVGDGFHVQLTEPAGTLTVGGQRVVEEGESFSGCGARFADAFNDAYAQLAAEFQAVAA